MIIMNVLLNPGGHHQGNRETCVSNYNKKSNCPVMVTFTILCYVVSCLEVQLAYKWFEFLPNYGFFEVLILFYFSLWNIFLMNNEIKLHVVIVSFYCHMILMAKMKWLYHWSERIKYQKDECFLPCPRMC